MTSPAVNVSCPACFDLHASRHRLEVELARVVRERDHYAERVKELQARGTELLEEVRQLRAERGRDDHLTFAGGTLEPLEVRELAVRARDAEGGS